jgi:hypothetical protein
VAGFEGKGTNIDDEHSLWQSILMWLEITNPSISMPETNKISE